MTYGGYGYGTNVPSVHFVGGGGSGASGVAVLVNGVVVKIILTDSGSGYSSVPKVLIAAPPGVPSVAIQVHTVKVVLTLVPGYSYQLQQSADARVWSDVGTPFLALDSTRTEIFEAVELTRFFRVIEAP